MNAKVEEIRIEQKWTICVGRAAFVLTKRPLREQLTSYYYEGFPLNIQEPTKLTYFHFIM